jgi:hypothetical protein
LKPNALQAFFVCGYLIVKRKSVSMEKLNCEQAKRLDLVEYLAFLGHQPQKVTNGDYWYLSPLRDERTASFKVNRNRGIRFDHGIGKGGDLIDFGTLYHNCSVSELLERLSGYQTRPVLSFHPPIISGNLSGANSSSFNSLLFSKCKPSFLKYYLNRNRGSINRSR